MLKTGMSISVKLSQKTDVTILWDYSIQKDIKIKANKSDITVKNKKEKTRKLINLKIPADENASVAKFEKLSK